MRMRRARGGWDERAEGRACGGGPAVVLSRAGAEEDGRPFKFASLPLAVKRDKRWWADAGPGVRRADRTQLSMTTGGAWRAYVPVARSVRAPVSDRTGQDR